MGRWRSLSTGVVVSVADDKDDRFSGGGWVDAATPAPEPTPARRPNK